ncbi:MAG: hypothetical protein OXM57_12890 [bacterium]|nr:hypothetical protein [bacterium]MDE0353572.1 hypothetical protein [bacterium]
MRVVGIYNADGGLSGELRYAVDKVLGRSDCGLCELTHGWNAFGKRSWREACRSSAVPIELIHRDVATESQLATAGSLPAVLVGDEGTWRVAADRKLIASLRKDPAGFLDHLERELFGDTG